MCYYRIKYTSYWKVEKQHHPSEWIDHTKNWNRIDIHKKHIFDVIHSMCGENEE